ncbi:MAG: c-type cytochrome biogenesis protein CcmI [Clostridia bacterium]|nr:c-type cytochrome biogenesis protein CcmI [Clostridia bacterium]
MAIVINLLMVLVAAALVGYPLMARNRQKNYVFEGQEAEVNNKEILFSALGEIEFDYQMNKLNDEEYQELKAGYQRQALVILDQEEEQLEAELEKVLSKGKRSEDRGKPRELDHE